MAAGLVKRLRVQCEEETASVGRRLGSLLTAGDLVFLEGDLGAGKTTLVRYVAEGAQVPPGYQVTSPTFGLVHELPGRVHVIHADMYRLESPEDLENLGFEEWQHSAALVEWGEKLTEELGEPDLVVRIVAGAEEQRDLTFEPLSERGQRLVEGVGEG